MLGRQQVLDWTVVARCQVAGGRDPCRKLETGRTWDRDGTDRGRGLEMESTTFAPAQPVGFWWEGSRRKEPAKEQRIQSVILVASHKQPW